MKDTIVLVGRFQVNQLCSHEGYRYMLDKAVSENKRVIVLIGSAAVISKSDPLSYKHREAMFNEEYPTILVRELKDICTNDKEADDQKWTDQVDTIVEKLMVELGPCGDVKMHGGRDSFLAIYKNKNGKFKTEYLDNEEIKHHSATIVRNKIKDTFISNQWVRYGLIQAEMKRYDTMYPTVDVMVTRNNGSQVLLAQKPEELNTGIWRCIGGFIEPGDGSGLLAGARELNEEANLKLNISDFKYVTQCEITLDPRYKYTKDSIMTTLFTVECPEGMLPVGGDDIALVKWFDIADVKCLINPFHKELWNNFLLYSEDEKKRKELWAEFLAFKAQKELVLQ